MKKWDLNHLDADFFDDHKSPVDCDSDDKLTYKVLIADDDLDVHKVTKLMLKGFEFEGKTLELLHAYSGEETIQICKEHPDIAILFLDVVMETKQSGLEVVKVIRENLNNNLLRIILRTGQPGQAPEEEVIKKYDINDYRLKTELTLKRLNTSLHSALRNYRDLVNIENHRRGLQQIVASSSRVFRMSSIDDFYHNILFELGNFKLSNSLFDLRSKSKDQDVDGFVFSRKNHTMLILAAIGKYKNYLGIPMDKLPAEIRPTKDPGLDQTGEVEILPDGFFVNISNKNTESIHVYIEGSIEDYDFDLINIFISSYSIALDNFIINNMIQSTQREIIFALAETVESQFEETGNHVKRVTKMMYNFALLNNFSYAEAESIELASSMHDLGKVAIPSHILKKPGKLTDEEFEIIKTHAEQGYRILSNSNLPVLKLASEIAYHHHEKYNGRGYPNRMKGAEIPLSARMMAIVDVFDALTHKRVYKEAMPLEEAVSYLISEKGEHFDPRLIDVFVENLDLILKNVIE